MLSNLASEGRTSFHAYVFLKEVLKYENKPEIIVDRVSGVYGLYKD